jgi:hypothetical protein
LSQLPPTQEGVVAKAWFTKQFYAFKFYEKLVLFCKGAKKKLNVYPQKQLHLSSFNSFKNSAKVFTSSLGAKPCHF